PKCQTPPSPLTACAALLPKAGGERAQLRVVAELGCVGRRPGKLEGLEPPIETHDGQRPAPPGHNTRRLPGGEGVRTSTEAHVEQNEGPFPGLACQPLAEPRGSD